MTKFYGTFMQKQAFKNQYITIHANNMALARAAMFDHFGDKFVTVYDEEIFAGQPLEFNLTELTAIQVIDHGHGSVEYKALPKILA